MSRDAAAPSNFGPATTFEVADHVRWVDSDDGPALLDLRTGRYLALNRMGGLVWRGLERGEAHGPLVERLAAQFDAVPAKRLRRDVGAFLDELLRRGIVRVGPAAAVATGAPLPLRVEQFTPPSAPPPSPVAEQTVRLRFRAGWMMLSYLGLLTADLYLKLRGFARFHALLKHLPPGDPALANADLARALSRVVDRAAAYYFKRAWCLQRSAVAAALLRLRGLPAELVIGVRRLPFGAHAWVELEGEVINDHPGVRRIYQILERC